MVTINKQCRSSARLHARQLEQARALAGRCLNFHRCTSVTSRPRGPSVLPSTVAHICAHSHAGALAVGRTPSLRAQHPAGLHAPFATYQGSAQVAGLLKERSQDYFLATDNIVPEGGIYCSQTVWDYEDGVSLASTGDCASAAGCSTRTNGTGLLSSQTAAGAPSMVVTGVFDGHGGEMSARYAQEAILSYIANDRRLHQSLGVGDALATAAALRSTFRKVDQELLDLAAAFSSSSSAPGNNSNDSGSGLNCGSSSEDAASPSGCRASAQAPLASGTVRLPRGDVSNRRGGGGSGGGDFRDGTTALVTVQLGGLLAVANAGDSRAVLCRAGQAVRLSLDHTPALRAERERIEAAGGQVVVARGAARVLVPLAGSRDVMQALSVSRSLGDPDFKACGLLIADPDVEVVPLQPGADAFLIAASDGLWGRVGDQEAVDCVNEVLQEYAAMSSHAGHNTTASAAKAAARRLLRLALDQGSVDDVTVVVSVFAWAP